MAESFFDRHFVWWSSRDSIAAEKISLLAVTEVIFSVAAYWWIAWYFDTYAHLLISILVAPLVLLRSDESVALGVEMFSRYLKAGDAPLRSAKGVSVVIVSALAAGAAGWLAADWFLIGHEGWPLFWRATLIGLFALNAGLAVAVALAVTAVELVAETIDRAGGVPEPVMAFGVVLFLAFGVLIRAVATRLLASLRHIHRGAADFPKNWRRTLFQIDLRCAPELVPGIGEEESEFSLEERIDEFISGAGIGEKTFQATFILIFFVPSLLYRYSIKSTCWLYLPLIYLAHLPGRLRGGEGRLVWTRALPAKFIEGIRFALAVLTLGIAVFALIDAAELLALLKAAGAGETPVTIFSLLVVLDFGDIRPWQYFTLPSAGLTILLVLWLDSIRKEEAAGATIDALGWKITTAIFTDRVRSLLVYIWLGLALYYFAEYAYGRCLLPDWITSSLEWRFGPPTCAAPDDSFRRHLGVV